MLPTESAAEAAQSDGSEGSDGSKAENGIERQGGARWSRALREAAHRTDLEIARQVEGSDEVTEVVQALEQQYDAFTAGNSDLLADEPENMPTAEELGAQFERFLAEQQGRGDNPDA
jgi:hypothetical protein